ncbi:kinesin-like protein KIF16B, partial [Elysia marginata]
LKGPEVLPWSHCYFENIGGEVTLCPCEGALCTVNGVDVDAPTKLSQGDTILLGKTNMFTFSLPNESQIPIGFGAALDPRRSWENSSMLTSSIGSLSDLPSPVSKVPPPQMFNPSLEVEHSFKTEVDRIRAAKERLEDVRREAERREEANQDMEEKLWAQHERQKDELQADRIRLSHLTDAARRDLDLAQSDIRARRGRLMQQEEEYQAQLRKKISRAHGNSIEDPSQDSAEIIQSDIDGKDNLLASLSDGEMSPSISGEIGADIRVRKSSLQGKIKDLAQREFLHTLNLRDSARTLGWQEAQVAQEFERRQWELRERKSQIDQREAEYLARSAVILQDIQAQKAEVDKLAAQQEQLELYLEEKQDLLYVGLDTPRPVRSACSELGLNDVDTDQTQTVDFAGDFPSKTASTQELGDSGNFRKISGENAGQKRVNVGEGRRIWKKENGNASSDDDYDDEDDDDGNYNDDDDDDDDDDEEEEGGEEEEEDSDSSDNDFEEDEVKKKEIGDAEKAIDHLDGEEVMEHDFIKDKYPSINASRKNADEVDDTTENSGYFDILDETCHDISRKHPNLSNITSMRSAGSGRPSRGRTRIQRMRPAPLPQVDTLQDSASPDKSITDAAAAVTARLYQPRAPRDDLKGNYLKGSKERISSPLSSPVLQRKEFNRGSRDSPLRTLSSSSERDRESPPKHSFLRKGSKKQRTSPVHLPVSPSGRLRDKDAQTVPKFDYLRKGSRKDYVAEVDKDMINVSQAEIKTHDYLRRKDATDLRGSPRQRMAKEEDAEKHSFLRRSDKQYVGKPHERLKRHSSIPGHESSHSSQPSKSYGGREETAKETPVHGNAEPVEKNAALHTKKKTKRDISGPEKEEIKHERKHLNKTRSTQNAYPEHQKTSKEKPHRNINDSLDNANAEQCLSKRQRRTKQNFHDQDSSSENIPKHKYLKKGSGKQPSINPTPSSSVKKDKASTEPPSSSYSETKSNRPKEHFRTIPRSQSYPGPDSFPISRDARSRIRLVSSMTSLASVPELSSEEEKHEQQQSRDAQVVGTYRLRKRPKARQMEDQEWRRHSHPEGEQLASALAEYMERMEGGLATERNVGGDSVSNATCSVGDLALPLESRSRQEKRTSKYPTDVPEIVVSSYDSNPSSPRNSQDKHKSSGVKVRLPLKPKATNVRRNKPARYDNSGANIIPDVLESITKTIADRTQTDIGNHPVSDKEIHGEDESEMQVTRASSTTDSDVDISQDSLDEFDTNEKACNIIENNDDDDNILSRYDSLKDDLEMSQEENAAVGDVPNTQTDAEGRLDELQKTEMVRFSTEREIHVKCQVPDIQRDMEAVDSIVDSKADLQDHAQVKNSKPSKEHTTSASAKPAKPSHKQSAHGVIGTPLKMSDSEKPRSRIRSRNVAGKVASLEKTQHSKQTRSSMSPQRGRILEKSEDTATPSGNTKKRRPKSDSGPPSSSFSPGRRNPLSPGANRSMKRPDRGQESLFFHRAHSAPSRVESTYRADYVDHTNAALGEDVPTVKKRVRDLFAPSEDLAYPDTESPHSEANAVSPGVFFKPYEGQTFPPIHEVEGFRGMPERSETLFRSSGSIPAYDRGPEFANLQHDSKVNAKTAREQQEVQIIAHDTSQIPNVDEHLPIDTSLRAGQNVQTLEQKTKQRDINALPLHPQHTDKFSADENSRERPQEQATLPGKLVQIGPNTFRLVSTDSDTQRPLEQVLTLDPNSSCPTTVGDSRGREREETRWHSQLSEDDPVSSAQQQIQALQEVLQQLSPR